MTTDTAARPLDDHNLVWIDLEMTGLVPDARPDHRDRRRRHRRAARRRTEGPVLAIHQSDETLAAMDAWNTGTHGRSGLTDRVRASTVDEAEAERAGDRVPAALRPEGHLADVRQQHLPGPALPRRDDAALEAFFHYRNLDVSTLKELARRWRPELLAGFRKAQAHTALADIQESIDELAYYREHFLRAVQPAALRETRSRCRIMGLPQNCPDSMSERLAAIRSSPLTVSVARLRFAERLRTELCTQGRRRCRR